MGLGFEQGAVYTPRYAREGRSIRGPDEDAFTMMVAAIEALGVGRPAGRPAKVVLLGEYPSAVDAALLSYLGGPVELVHRPGDVTGWMSAVQEAIGGAEDSTTLAVASELDGPRGAGAVAVRWGSHPASPAPEWPAATVDAGSAAALVSAALVRWSPNSARTTAVRPPPPAWASDPLTSVHSIDLRRVSEGAYVPRARYVENLPSRWRLEADRCAHCGKVTFPQRGTCRSCGRSDRLTSFTLPREGARVVAATAIGKGGQPTEFDPQVEAFGGYAVVLAEFEPGVRLTLQVTDASPGEVRIGDRVGTRLRRLYAMDGEWRYGRKAVPLDE
jgi:uncharacterized OB-fold protein